MVGSCVAEGGTEGVTQDGRASCTMRNCDGAGGKCIVVCDDTQCLAQTPHVLKAGLTLHYILRDGNRVKPTPQLPNNFWGDPAEPAFEMH